MCSNISDGGHGQSQFGINKESNGSTNDDFRRTVECIATSEGFDPGYTAALFGRLSSSDFVCGEPTVRNRQQIPDRVWQRVCEHYDASNQRPYRQQMGDNRLNVGGKSATKNRQMQIKTKSIPKPVFISNKVTAKLVQSKVIVERTPGSDKRRLFQFMNWMFLMNNAAQTEVVMIGRDGRRLLLVNMELHDQRGQPFYALCTTNDIPNAQKWQMVDLLTAQELHGLLDIDTQCLPKGVRAESTLFEEYRRMKGDLNILKIEMLRNCDHGISVRASRPKPGRQRNGRKRTKTVKESSFYDAVRRSMEEESVLPLMGQMKRSKRFSVDYLLPIRLESEWVGLVFRDCQPVMILLDRHDITNKVILCDPSFDVAAFQWFDNSFDRLKIVPDDVDTEEKSVSGDLSESSKNYNLSSNGSLTDSPSSLVSSPGFQTPPQGVVNFVVIQPLMISVPGPAVQWTNRYPISNVMYNQAYAIQCMGWKPAERK